MAQSLKASIVSLMAVMFACTALPAASQAPAPTPAPRNTVAIKPVPVRSVLRLLFVSVGKKYIIDPDVQGIVDGPVLSDGSFESLLEGIIEYTVPPIRYDVKNDVYYFHLKHIPAPDEVQQHITLHFTGSVRDAVETLFQQAKLDEDDLRINPGVQGNVTVDLKDVSFSTALNTLLTTANPALSYDLKGRYLISVKPPANPTRT